MGLWIRSQDKSTLMKVDRLDIDYSQDIYKIKANGFATLLAVYPTEKRALEILTEIGNRLAAYDKFILKQRSCLLSRDDVYKEKIELEKLNNINLITGNSLFEIEPIAPKILFYEMPEK